ncbi:MAG: DUF4249 family protein [Ignavibacteriales bacterium]|nr:DUF4249 family protein [Ignavibacteriales bacterium]
MKQHFTLILIIIPLIIWLFSCDENLSPKGELTQKYSVNLLLRGDTTLQCAYISHLYDVAGFDPSTLSEDPVMLGSQISIKYINKGTTYYFRDTLDNNNLNPRYNSPSKYSYLKSFRPDYNSEIELSVNLPDGQKLTSKTTVPGKINFDESKTTNLIFIPPLIVYNYDSVYVNVFWKNENPYLFKAKRISFNYYHKDETGKKTLFVKQIPISTLQEGIQTGFDYNDVSLKDELHIERKLVEQALKEISEGDLKKSTYYVGPIQIEILLFDENLSKYYNSKLYFDYGFTIRNFPADMTNINGGLGFFASYSQTKRTIKFDDNYLLKKFGYLPESSTK